MEILIVVLITTVAFGLCFRFAPHVDKVKKQKQMRDYMHDHEKVVSERLGISSNGDEQPPDPVSSHPEPPGSRRDD